MSSSSKRKAPPSPNKRVSKPRTTRATARTSTKPSHAQASRASMPTPEVSIDKDWQDEGDWHQPSDKDNGSDDEMTDPPVTEPPSPAKPKRGRPPKGVQVAKARAAHVRHPTTLKLPAFQDIATLSSAFVQEVIYMLKLAIVHDRDKANVYKERRAFDENHIKYLEKTMKYESTLSPEDKSRYHERKLQETRVRLKNAEVADSRLQKEKVELEFKLSLVRKEVCELQKELKKANDTHENAEMLGDLERAERLVSGGPP